MGVVCPLLLMRKDWPQWWKWPRLFCSVIVPSRPSPSIERWGSSSRAKNMATVSSMPPPTSVPCTSRCSRPPRTASVRLGGGWGQHVRRVLRAVARGDGRVARRARFDRACRSSGPRLGMSFGRGGPRWQGRRNQSTWTLCRRGILTDAFVPLIKMALRKCSGVDGFATRDRDSTNLTVFKANRSENPCAVQIRVLELGDRASRACEAGCFRLHQLSQPRVRTLLKARRPNWALHQTITLR